MSTVPSALLYLRYEEAAREYLRNLPPTHFMESVSQATQRKITLASLELVHAQRPEVQVFNELLVQYPGKGDRKYGQVVPDNMVVLHDKPIKADGSFNIPLQPVGPFWVLEYVSKSTARKDYDQNLHIYEADLKIPYYLLFAPEAENLTLFRRSRTKYVSVLPNEQERYAIPELDIEMALVEGWTRFWYRGELLPLPGDMQRELEELNEELSATRRNLRRETRRAAKAEREAAQEKQAREDAEAELARLRALLEQQDNE